MRLILYCVQFFLLNLCLFNGISAVTIDWKCLFVHFPSYRKLLIFTVLHAARLDFDQLYLHCVSDQTEINNIILNQIIRQFFVFFGGGFRRSNFLNLGNMKLSVVVLLRVVQWGVFPLYSGNKTMWRPSSIRQLPVNRCTCTNYQQPCKYVEAQRTTDSSNILCLVCAKITDYCIDIGLP